MFQPNYDPAQQKVDAERVLQFLINKIRVKGSVGAYGRSIGGIAASHLVGKFPNVIKVFVGDRTLGTFDDCAKTRFPSTDKILKFSDLISCKWRMNNVDGFLENKNCFKIHCCDVDDDVIDIFAAHSTAIARYHCKIDYGTLEWGQFYESLNFIFDMENELHEWAQNNGKI